MLALVIEKFYSWLLASLCLLLLSAPAFSQTLLKGVVKDASNTIFAASIYLKNNTKVATTADFDGNFELSVNLATDTLVVSFIGYQGRQIVLSNQSASDVLVVVLRSRVHSLPEVIITAKNPISKRFSAVELTKMEIYLNPVSAGDPLRALAFIPAATTTDESANPSFRGSTIDRTRVVLNGVPVYQPVRNTQINKVGNFSIFNPEMLDKEYAYASNPPLTYGNTSSGLVEISTLSELANNQIQFSTTLSSLDLFLSQKLGKGSFMQLFSNYQFSKPFIQLNAPNFNGLNSFETKDVGLNFNVKLSKDMELNSFSYAIDESYDALLNEFTYTGRSVSGKKRFFTINNFKAYTSNGLFSINAMFDRGAKDFHFGNISYDKQLYQTYASINYKRFISKKITLQGGFTSDYQKNTFDNVSPVYFYAQSPTSPSETSSSDLTNHNLEGYLYANWDLGTQWTFFAGMRSNIPIKEQSPYLSSQLGVKYQISSDHFLLLSGGSYNSYSLPEFYNQKFDLLKSSQIALEYTYDNKSTLVKAASFYTADTGPDLDLQSVVINNKNTFGVEFSFEQYLHRYLKMTFANTYLHQRLINDTDSYVGDSNFNYFIKSSLSYNNPKLFSTSIIYIGRPGDFYTPITGAAYDPATNFYNPTFSNTLNSKSLGNYNRVDVSVSKYVRFNNWAVVCFASLNNLFNSKNDSGLSYNTDYTAANPQYYQLRMLFFGAVFSLNY